MTGLAAISGMGLAMAVQAQTFGHARVKFLGSDQNHRLQLQSGAESYLPSLLLRQEDGNPLKLERKQPSAGAQAHRDSMRLISNGLERDDYVIKLHGLEVRGFYLTEVYKEGRLLQGLGRLPEDGIAFPATIDEASWLPEAKWQEIIAAALMAEAHDPHDFSIEKGENVFWYDGQSQIIPTTEITLNYAGKPYRFQINASGVQAREALYFDVNGVGLVYPENPVDSEATEVAIKDLTGTGLLETKYLKSKPQQHEAAYNRDHKFVFDENDYQFQETNAFVHLQQVYQWFVGLGYVWHTPGSLYLYAHENEESNDANNAYYQPNGGNPKIRIGVGDGVALQNLSLDMDVVSHEFGHHIIFQYIQTTGNEESLVMHEGLADFFAFAKSGDPCLGESICPANSPYCEVRGQCLRTAENNLNYDDSSFTQLMPHQKGQIISGLLWDLKNTDNLTLEKVTTLTFKAISFLPQESIFEDLFLSLLTADHELNKGKNSCAIIDMFKKRGFGVFANQVNCEDLNYSDYLDNEGKVNSSIIANGRTVTQEQNSGTTSAATRSSRRTKSSGCGSLGWAAGPESAPSAGRHHAPLDPIFILILSAPFLLILQRRKI